MNTIHIVIGRWCLPFCLAVAIFTAVSAQERHPAGGPLTGPPVLNAPFTADATTTVRQTLSDGTRVEQRATARYYRDRAGRVRIEQIVTDSGEVRITVAPDPAIGITYTRDETTRIVRESPRILADRAIGGGDNFVLPLSGLRFVEFVRAARRDMVAPGGYTVESEALGRRRIGDIDATGSRITTMVSDSQFGHGRPIEVVDERWESPDLKMLVESRYADPRVGVIEYQLRNIGREEPPSDLFAVPTGSAGGMVTGKEPQMSVWPANPPNGVKLVPRIVSR